MDTSIDPDDVVVRRRTGSAGLVRALDAIAAPVSLGMAVISAAGVVLIMMIMVLDVVMRTSTGASIRGAYEIIVTILVVVVFMGAPYAERSGANVKVTILTDRLRGSSKRVVHSLASVIILGISGWLAIAVIGDAQASFASNEMTLGVVSFPMWPAKAAIAVGLTFLAVEATINVVRSIAGASDGLVADAADALSSSSESASTMGEVQRNGR